MEGSSATDTARAHPLDLATSRRQAADSPPSSNESANPERWNSPGGFLTQKLGHYNSYWKRHPPTEDFKALNSALRAKRNSDNSEIQPVIDSPPPAKKSDSPTATTATMEDVKPAAELSGDSKQHVVDVYAGEEAGQKGAMQNGSSSGVANEIAAEVASMTTGVETKKDTDVDVEGVSASNAEELEAKNASSGPSKQIAPAATTAAGAGAAKGAAIKSPSAVGAPKPRSSPQTPASEGPSGNSPASGGRKVTVPEPFSLATDKRASMHKAAELPSPTSSKVLKPGEVRASFSSPQVPPKPSAKPSTSPDPFKLASVQRHEAAQGRLKAQMLEKEKQEEAKRKFKAQPVALTSPVTPSRVKPAPTTRVTGFRFACEERAEKRKETQHSEKQEVVPVVAFKATPLPNFYHKQGSPRTGKSAVASKYKSPARLSSPASPAGSTRPSEEAQSVSPLPAASPALQETASTAGEAREGAAAAAAAPSGNVVSAPDTLEDAPGARGTAPDTAVAESV